MCDNWIALDFPTPYRTTRESILDIREVLIHSVDAQTLIALLDQELQRQYAPEHTHPVEIENFHREGGIFVLAYDAEQPIACGALRVIDQANVELKRMFVVDSHRGRGCSRQVLLFLENKAVELGFRKLLLETGDEQHAAIGLYNTSGFQRIAPFGEYIKSSRSVCFAKDL